MTLNKLPYGSCLYISGKMSGLPCFNFKYVFHWQVVLEKSGYKVINPAELDCLKMFDGWKYSEDQWDSIVEEDCDIIRSDKVDAVFVIGKDYVTSGGAHREITAALEAGKDVYYENDQRS